jgi:hypothetical protein
MFHELLAEAIARGRRPHHVYGLGAATRAAIDAVACEHPDAEPEQIIAAYDAFAAEQTVTLQGAVDTRGESVA